MKIPCISKFRTWVGNFLKPRDYYAENITKMYNQESADIDRFVKMAQNYKKQA